MWQALLLIFNQDMLIQTYYDKMITYANAFHIKYRNIYNITTTYSPLLPRRWNGFCDSGDHTIVINAYFWESESPLQKQWLIAHEWLHCATNSKHKAYGIMFPYFPTYELTEEEVKEEIFNELQEIYEQQNVKE